MKDRLKMDTKLLKLRVDAPSLFSMLPDAERKHNTKQTKMMTFGGIFTF